ncbi:MULTISPECIES: hypothetical protein [Streptomyces]|nr:hypothetical protein [Streptomyces sp. SID2888]MYV48868.1 hypothetical protein [Streptomyces sp. SID2888]
MGLTRGRSGEEGGDEEGGDEEDGGEEGGGAGRRQGEGRPCADEGRAR